jgi:soluble lytic murein transglycosylase-like protein
VQKFLLSFVIFALPAPGGEYAVLANGFRIHADRHEQADGLVRLMTGSGMTEVAAGFIVAFEQEEHVPQTNVGDSAPPPALPNNLTPPAPPDPKVLIRQAALRAGLPPAFVESVALVESGMHPDAVSPKGAIGIMQLMPSTAKTLDADPHDIAQNIDGGARLLRDLLIKYEGNVAKALSAYNAGSGAVDKYRGIPPYRETWDYVNRVIRTYLKAGGK